MLRNLEQIKGVSLPMILADVGIRPANRQDPLNGRTAYLYYASYREEQNPSLSIFLSHRKPEWLFHDLATGEKGTSLDLLVKFGICSDWREAAQYINDRYVRNIVTQGIETEIGNNLQILFSGKCPQNRLMRSVSIVGSPAEKYITFTRKIPLPVAEKYLSYIEYLNVSSGRTFHGIGWKTENGGYGIRWAKDFPEDEHGKGKSFVGQATYSFFPIEIGVQTERCLLFEGIFDFLSFIAEQNGIRDDAIVLNSAANKEKSLPLLDGYQYIVSYIDADTTGKEALEFIRHHIGSNIIDRSGHFSPYKDYNEYWKQIAYITI